MRFRQKKRRLKSAATRSALGAVLSMIERLQKIIARAGVASRRHAEQLMSSGQVTVNGQVITELGTKADAARDHIKVSGRLLQGAQEHVYLVLHKPAEVVATMSDPEGRRSVADLLPGVPARVYPVGRLEYHASGLLFLTNDGDLANRILRAHGLRQVYFVKVKGNLTDAEMNEAESASNVRISRAKRGENPWYEVTLAEASRDPLRDKLAMLGHPVEKMKRVKLGNIEIGDIPPGRFRQVSREEIEGLEKLLVKTEVRSRGGAKPQMPASRRAPSMHIHERVHEPADKLMRVPTGKPTFKPTFKPTDRPANRPSHKPAFTPTNKWKHKPADKPAHGPGNKWTHKPANKRAGGPSHRPANKWARGPANKSANRFSKGPDARRPRRPRAE